MLELSATAKQSYQGDGIYKLALTDFAECYLEVQQPGLRLRLQSLLDTPDTFTQGNKGQSNPQSKVNGAAVSSKPQQGQQRSLANQAAR